MATNKRTDSAALFELIDKSTLKVPKTAGSLKIPSWWSSKTNPSVVAPVPTAPAAARPAPKPVEAAPAPAALANGSAVASAVAEPIRKESTPAAAPSIRAPYRPPVPSPARRPSSGVFAPQTHDQSAPLSGETRGAPPAWLILAGSAAVVVILICVIVVVMRSGHHTSAPAVQGGSENPPAVKTTFIPAPPAPDVPSDPNPPINADPGQIPPAPQPQPAGQARVVPFDEVKRIPNYVYLFIFTATEKAAQANAQYLADHGISTSVKATNQGKYYEVISVDGFAGLADPKCEALRTEVVKLGRAHPDAKRMAGKGVYDSAYFARIVIR